ncbi:DUF5316 family protein [Paenibacillus solani]|uniref:Uncharacterized protein n=1 Tax=Paenibacillus solani TaxID=1705565 RepID=A0A0M1NJQ1_9BACL|nr:DUF5316 family protein [Paenibacillus solani]KOR82468.1 hypothetical protein AM231_19320 [Paenibacillus solani]
MNFLITAGLVCLAITGLLSGAFTTGYQQRGNFYADSKDDRASKKVVANGFFLAGLAFLAAAGIVYLFN